MKLLHAIKYVLPILLALLVAPMTVTAVPGIPRSYHGQVFGWTSGEPIQVYDAGGHFLTTCLVYHDVYGIISPCRVAADDLQTDVVEGGREGEAMTFTREGVGARERPAFSGDYSRKLDLHFDGPKPGTREALAQYLDLLMGDTRLLTLFGPAGIQSPDFSGNGNYLQWQKAGQATGLQRFDRPPSVLGKGWSVRLNGLDERGKVKSSPSLGLENTITLALLVKLNYPPSRHIIGKYHWYNSDNSPQDQQWLATITSDGYLSFSPVDALLEGEDVILETIPIPTDTWVFYLITYDGPEHYSIYRNGRLTQSRYERLGNYIQMRLTSEPIYLGFENTPLGEVANAYAEMDIAFLGISASLVTSDNAERMTRDVEDYFGITLEQ